MVGSLFRCGFLCLDIAELAASRKDSHAATRGRENVIIRNFFPIYGLSLSQACLSCFDRSMTLK
jgi:hypothetical protein